MTRNQLFIHLVIQSQFFKVEKAGVLNLYNAPFVKIGNGHYFFVSNMETNWFDAYEYCRGMDTHLITFETMDEWNLISDYMKDKEMTDFYWTSGTDLANYGTHTWFSNGKPITLNIWRIGEPNNYGGNEHCDAFYIFPVTQHSALNDEQCVTLRRFICEVP
ncbi:hypothetical protein KR074_001648, partial [Drosophila pseudoananassae]